jgi:peptide chain release factor 1
MFERLAGLETEYEDVLVRLQDPNVFSDQRAYVKLSRRLKELEPIVLAFREHRAT